MTDCDSYDDIIKRPSYGDRARRYALQKLVEEGCIESLFQHAQAFSRMDWIRNYALLALTKYANISTTSKNVAITLKDDEIILDTEKLDVSFLRKEAAKYLFLFLLTPKKPSKFKKIALMGLLAGKYWELCDELVNDENVEQWIKDTILAAKKVRS